MKPNETKNSNIVNQFALMLTNPKFLLKLASRERPDNFFRSLDNIRDFIQTDNFIVVASLDIDDHTMISKQVKERIETYKNVKAYWGTSLNKTDAINRDIAFADGWDVIINWSDDLLWVQQGFDEIIKVDANTHFPDGDFFLHYPESHSRDRQATVSIMDRKYFDRFNYVYNPIYASVYSDTEALEVSKRLGRHKFINNQLFEHFHPIWRTADWDALYRRNEDQVFYKKDKETYFKRLNENFGL